MPKITTIADVLAGLLVIIQAPIVAHVPSSDVWIASTAFTAGLYLLGRITGAVYSNHLTARLRQTIADLQGERISAATANTPPPPAA